MLQGDGTPSAPQAPTGQQDDSIQPIEQQTEEEIEFNKLSGSAQERFRDALNGRRAAEERAAFFEQQLKTPSAQNSLLPDQKQAVETLAQFGIATDDKVKTEVGNAVNQIRWELKNASLQQRYTGVNGEPQYDATEVENYMRTHPQYASYDPEDVFKYKMYKDEFENLGGEKPAKKQSSSLKPTRAQNQQPQSGDITWLMDRIDPKKYQDADEYAETHKDEINAAIKDHTMQFKDVNFSGQ